MSIIVDEYKMLLVEKNKIEHILPSLPKGYISKKAINKNTYYYFQTKVNGKIQSKYLKKEELDTYVNQVKLLKQYKKELPILEKRIAELEQAAKLINKKTFLDLLLLKNTEGMDSLNPVQKELSISFATAMNAIEGNEISKKTERNIERWKEGKKSFSSIFNETLAMYGFKEK
ncbi:MAG: hypothetical protein ACRCZJ_07630 [Erysipelotrichaceae bacterium]